MLEQFHNDQLSKLLPTTERTILKNSLRLNLFRTNILLVIHEVYFFVKFNAVLSVERTSEIQN